MKRIDFAASAVLATTVFFTTPAVSADPVVAGEIRMLLQPKSVPAARDIQWRRVGPGLTALHDQYIDHLATQSPGPFRSPSRFVFAADNWVTIDAAAEGDVAELEAALTSLGAVDIASFNHLVSARLPLDVSGYWDQAWR